MSKLKPVTNGNISKKKIPGKPLPGTQLLKNNRINYKNGIAAFFYGFTAKVEKGKKLRNMKKGRRN
ncbi:MAG: hypothetical protein AAGU10_12320 [Methanosarcina mazei]|uniref:hypothetical protein n=1 Tax=Methanosarcina soligelidi TaxID=1036677 RepID=UPI00064EC04C|nr:hypothetical protein [Methanosarcina soligelidi]